MTLRVLALTEYSDRGEFALFEGLRGRDVDLRIMCPSHSPHHQGFIDAGFNVIDFAPEKRVDFAAGRVIANYAAANRIDIVHTFNARAVTASILALRKMPHVRLVAYRGIVGNVSFLDPISWMRYLNPRIDRIVCVADAIKRYFESMRPAFLRVPSRKLVTIYKGHDVAWYDRPPVDLREFGIGESEFTIGCVANNRPRKGIDVLIRAVERLPEDVPWRLLLVGHMRSKALDRQIAASPVRERVVLTGFRDDAPAVIGACSIGVLPSLRREGLPRGVIEAMAQGVPNVVTDSGGSPELIEPGVSGLVARSGDPVTLADAIERLYREPTLRESMGAAARERIRNRFHYSRTVNATLALYRELTGGDRALSH